jgi:hypothetical protein
MDNKDKKVYNFQIEVHTVNRVYVSKLYTENNYVKYKDEGFDKVFLIVYDKSKNIKTLKEEFPIFINDKEMFLNPVNIEFIQVYKNLNEKEIVNEGIYSIADFPYDKYYQKKKSFF